MPSLYHPDKWPPDEPLADIPVGALTSGEEALLRAWADAYSARKVAAERERCKAAVQYSQIRNGYHEEHGQKIGHFNVRMFEWIDNGYDPRTQDQLPVKSGTTTP